MLGTRTEDKANRHLSALADHKTCCFLALVTNHRNNQKVYFKGENSGCDHDVHGTSTDCAVGKESKTYKDNA